MNHYFDDVFTRHVLNPSKPEKPKIRRSSTARSMGARSDFDTSEDGDHAHSVGNSVATETEERLRERREADAHTAQYVSEQLTRVRSNQSVEWEGADEFEAQLDGP
jgi:hypothetical protein